jgi:hypothetical protein
MHVQESMSHHSDDGSQDGYHDEGDTLAPLSPHDQDGCNKVGGVYISSFRCDLTALI